MEAGFVVYNDHDTVQVDSTYTNLSVLNKGTLTTDVGGNFMQPEMPPERIRVTRCSSAVAIPGRLIKSKTGNASVQWWLFGPPTDSGEFGLQVFDASQRLVFDSNRQYARVAGVFATSLNTTASRSYPAGRVYAGVVSQMGVRKLVTAAGAGDPGNWVSSIQYAGIRFSGTTAILEWVTCIQYFTEVAEYAYSDPDVSAIVLDVTGY